MSRLNQRQPALYEVSRGPSFDNAAGGVCEEAPKNRVYSQFRNMEQNSACIRN
jgi:hypothetical protein